MAGQANTAYTPKWGQKHIYILIAYGLLLQAFFGGSGLPWRMLLNQQPNLNQKAPAVAVPITPTELYFKPMADLAEPHGYKLVEHFVTTPDGYILRLFRLPPHQKACPCSTSTAVTHCSNSSTQGKTTWDQSLHNSSNPCSCTCSSSSNSTQHRPLVFMQHALMDSSAGWLLLGPGRALALQLADAGFDVWMGNSRGNRYSRNHTTLNPDEDPAFWSYSWDHMAQHDLPTSINYSMEVSGQQRLVYIGYSQGTMIGLAALSSQPKLASAISLAILMAPVSFTTAMTSPAFVLSSRLGLDEYGLKHGWTEWGSFQKGNSDAMLPVCRRFPWFCLGYLTAFCGKHPRGNVEPGLVPLIFQHLPAGTSVQVMAHWAQGIRRASTTHLHRFDYGSDCPAGNSSSEHSSSSSSSSSRKCNQQVYGQAEPTKYDLAAITTPIALYTGGRDTISAVADVELLKGVLQPGVLLHHHHQPDYAHLDFELGTDAPAVVYPELLKLALHFSMQQ